MKVRRAKVSTVAPCCDPHSDHPTVPSTAYKAKGALKADDLRRRREEQQVEIRRQKREENISKRRNFIPSSGPDSDDDVAVGSWDTDVNLYIYL